MIIIFDYLKFVLKNWKIYLFALAITLFSLFPVEGMLIFLVYGATENIIIAKIVGIGLMCILIYNLMDKTNNKFVDYLVTNNMFKYNFYYSMICKLLILLPYFIIIVLFSRLIVE